MARASREPERYTDSTSSTVLGITPARWAIMSYLLTHPEGAGTKTIAEAIGLDSAAVRAQLRAMVRDGAVTSTIDPYFVPQGQRPVYAANVEAIIGSLHEVSRKANWTLIRTEDLQPDELRSKIAKRLRSILKLIDQADGT